MKQAEEKLDGAEDPLHHGFKRITLANWNQMDIIIQFPSPVTADTWVRACLDARLGFSVPPEIAALFEVARGSMIYGWFFYPVITLATEQCFRILEAGARAKCNQLGLATQRKKQNGATSDKGFSELIKELEQAGQIDQPMRQRWETIRNLRNAASHPKRQSIYSPQDALTILATTSEFLNKFFPDPKPVAATLPENFPA